MRHFAAFFAASHAGHVGVNQPADLEVRYVLPHQDSNPSLNQKLRLTMQAYSLAITTLLSVSGGVRSGSLG